MPSTVRLLKKVTLSLSAAGAPGISGTTGPPFSFTFIYGVASDGLCPFETALHGKGEGERLEIRFVAADAAAYFGHLCHPLARILEQRPADAAIALEIEVVAVTDPDDREVVQAAARALGHGGCGTSCGCGCGG